MKHTKIIHILRNIFGIPHPKTLSRLATEAMEIPTEDSSHTGDPRIKDAPKTDVGGGADAPSKEGVEVDRGPAYNNILTGEIIDELNRAGSFIVNDESINP